VLAEAVRSLGANLSTTFAATTTVLIGMFMLGLVIGLGSWALSLSDHYKKQLHVKVYFCAALSCGKEATKAQMNDVHNTLVANPQVRSVRFVSKEEALKIERKRDPQYTKNLPGNPLPNEFEVVPKRGEDVDSIAATLNPLPAGVEKICPPPPGSKSAKTALGERCGRITHRVLSVANYLWIFVLIAFVVLLVSSTLLVANTIRLSIFARRREIEVMKLVGATNWFVRGPFMIEGVVVGFMGGVLAVLLLWIIKDTLVDPLSDRFALIAAPNTIQFPALIAVLLASCVAVSALGSGLTLRRFLRV